MYETPMATSVSDVAMRCAHGDPERSEPACEFFGNGNCTVASTRASDRDGQVAATFGFVLRKQRRQQTFDAVDEVASRRRLQDVIAHLGVVSGQRPQRIVPMRVRQKTNVEHDVRIERETVLEPTYTQMAGVAW